MVTNETGVNTVSIKLKMREMRKVFLIAPVDWRKGVE